MAVVEVVLEDVALRDQIVVGTGGVTQELIKMVEPRFKPENKENRFL